MKLKAKSVITDDYVTVNLLATNIKHVPEEGITYFEDISECYDPLPINTATIEVIKDENYVTKE